MGSITFTRASIGSVHAGCGAGGVTCMGSGHMLAHMEDFDILTDPVENRVWRSLDNGASWTELASVDSGNVWFYRSISTAVNRVLVGTEGPNFSNGAGGYDEDIDDAIAVTQNGGDSWAPGMDASALFNPAVFDDLWSTRDFIQLSATEVWAIGSYIKSGANEVPILVSTDGGLTFPAFGPSKPAGDRTLLSGVYLDPDIVLVGLEWASGSARVARSTNRGVSWSIIVLPITVGTYDGFSTSRVFTLCHLGGGVILAGGTTRDTVNRRTRLWRSTDSGVNWTELSAQLDVSNGVHRIVKLSSTAAVLVLTAPVGGPVRTPYFSEDSGATWSLATMTDALVADFDFVDLAVADNGTVIALYTKPGVGEPIYIYRGALVGITGAGLCASMAVASGLLGVRLDCVPLFSPVPCLVECPADPTQPVGQLVAAGGPGGGFRSALFFLGLTDGLPAVAGVTLGVPAACGATFANNYCAVAGC